MDTVSVGKMAKEALNALEARMKETRSKDKVVGLRMEISKFRDITAILARLESLGFIERIYDLFEEILLTEHEFTVRELSRIASRSKLPDAFDMREHYQMNTSIFKDNLRVIMDMIINQIWSSSKSQPPRSETGRSTQRTELTPLINEEDTPRGKAAGKATNGRGKLDVVREDEKDAADDEKKKSLANRLSSGRNVAKSMEGVRSREHEEEEVEIVVQERPGTEAARKKKGPQLKYHLVAGREPGSDGKPNTGSGAVAKEPSLKMSLSSKALSMGTSDSEIGHGTRGVKFSKDERRFHDKNENPGPGSYNYEEYARGKRSPSPKFNKSSKSSIFDRPLGESPGYIYQPSHHFSSK
eukprot:TRINITY_DN7043_c0_g3_i1.p1 TRINITY_DN7043_c0_g3~~TRINITY_DN7043_c0_g3_i1.p1  ORF type:complete len:355 (+),score=73.26 TRINITY_DN7043_c0_g3_i1:129-1193(+)